jgi:hypothetical protein
MGRGSNKARHGQGGQAQFINAYVEDMGQAGKTPFTSYAINGLELYQSIGTSNAMRVLFPLDDTLLMMTGRQLYTKREGLAPVHVGGVSGDGFMTMAANRRTPNKQVAIITDGLPYLYEAGTLRELNDPDLPPPVAVAEVDGYFIFPIADGRWFLAGPNIADVDPIDFAAAEGSADGNVMVIVRGRTILFFGFNSTEFWDANGDPFFPFGRTAVIRVGCYAAGTVAKMLNESGGSAVETVVFAATDHNGAYAGIRMLEGYTPTRISTPEVDRLVRDEPDKASLRAFGWSEDGKPFYLLTGTNFTKVYSNGEWHDRKSHNLPRWRISCHAQFGNRVLFGDYADSKVYESRFDLLDEAGAPIIWQMQPPPIHTWPAGFKLNGVYADMISGVGQVSGNAEDMEPELLLSVSKDGGSEFGVQRRIPLGVAGARYVKVSERAFGLCDGNGATLRFTCSAGVVKGMQQLAVDLKQLRVA